MKQLEKKGVEFRIGTAIKEATEEGIIVANGDDTELIKSETVVWAAGVRGNGIVEESGFEAMRGRVKLMSTCTLQDTKMYSWLVTQR